MGFGIDTSHYSRRWPRHIKYSGDTTGNPKIRQAMDVWQRSLGNNITFTQVTSSAHAMFKIEVIDPKMSQSGSKWISGDTLNGRKPGSTDGILRLKKSSKVGSVLHEIGHLLGLSHEQNRPDFTGTLPAFGDRAANKAQSYCKKYGPFDNDSIMLYASCRSSLSSLGDYEDMTAPSAGDVQAIKDIYNIT